MISKLIIVIIYSYAFTGGNYKPVDVFDFDLHVPVEQCNEYGKEITIDIHNSADEGAINLVQYYCTESDWGNM